MNPLAVDKEGYLRNLADWSPSVAHTMAQVEGISLSADHWELLDLLREFYDAFEVSPEMRVLVKWVRERLGSDKGNSLYLLTLFPGNPAMMMAKIAGLPRPTNCL